MSTICDICKTKMPFMAKVYKLADGTVLCNKCHSIIPSYMEESAQTLWNNTLYWEFVKYTKYAQKAYESIFSETANYKSIHIDAKNGLFYIADQKNKLILDMKYIDKFSISVEKPHLVTNIIGSWKNVHGSIAVMLEMMQPLFKTDIVLSSDTILKSDFANGKYEYQLPDKASKFQQIMISAYQRKIQAIEEYKRTRGYASFAQNEKRTGFGNKEPPISILEKAKTLFMFDDMDINKITMNMLKKQRNRLLKTYHPDEGETNSDSYVQKINNAYDVLCKHING